MVQGQRVAVIGAGMIGRAWAVSFAKAGCRVTLWDLPEVLSAATRTIRTSLHDLAVAGLTDDPEAAFARIRVEETLEAALDGAGYVQENLPETIPVKQDIFRRLDRLAPAATILASSTSAIPASAFTEELTGRSRCLVAHPANPPYLLPIVELCGAPWTEPAVMDRTAAFLNAVGQEPIQVKREIPGFILNRLQGALLNEAFRLVQEGYVTAEDVDITVRHGLGLRWSFIGPFETIDLNAPGGVRDYCARYGPFYTRLRADAPVAEPWSEELVARLEAERRDVVPMDAHPARQAWRDRRLMALAAHKRAMEQSES
jgi:L-gulonate 3-dehydrogenase